MPIKDDKRDESFKGMLQKKKKPLAKAIKKRQAHPLMKEEAPFSLSAHKKKY